MNRTVFSILSLALFFFLLVLDEKGHDVPVFYGMVGFMVLIFLRRWYLKLKPYWWSRLRDIPKYFKEP